MTRCGCLAVGVLMSLAAGASEPVSKSTPPPEDSLLEFLGSDDVGDSKWWDFFNRSGSKDDEESGNVSNGEDPAK